MTKYIVIGASASGIATASKLRDLDKNAEIIIIASQKNLPHNKCLLADYLSNSIPKERIFLKQQDFFDKSNIRLQLKTEVIKIKPGKNKILTNSSQELNYDKLFLGLGTRPFIPKIPGLENITDIFTFQNLHDIQKISKFIKQNQVKSVAIMGTGLTGFECSDTFSGMGIKTYLISRGSQIIPKQVDPKGSQILEDLMLKSGVIFKKNKNIKNISQKIINNKKEFVLEFKNNKTLKVDMLVFTSGTLPNIEIAQEAGIKCLDKRILINKFMQTNIKNIYSGGDICLVKNIINNKLIPSCTWPDATMQGINAAYNMTNQAKSYAGILPTTSSKIFDTTFISCGEIFSINNHYKTIEESGTEYYHKYVINNNQLIGFLMVNKIKDIGKLKNIILKKERFTSP